MHHKGFRPKTWHYTWNALDQLTRVTTPTRETWQYAYDPLGRRINKYNPQTHTSHHYIWDGDVILQEITLSGEGEAQQTDITTWHHEGFTPLLKEQQGQVYHVITDPVGTPKELLTTEGELAWSGYHRTWGQLSQTRYGDQGHQTDCPIRYPGQYEDAESGLHYNRFRYYDTDIDQYLSPDPIGLEGRLQPHAYVPDPNGWVDPLGLAGCKNFGKNWKPKDIKNRKNWNGCEQCARDIQSKIGGDIFRIKPRAIALKFFTIKIK